jgi:hypothetical protein
VRAALARLKDFESAQYKRPEQPLHYLAGVVFYNNRGFINFSEQIKAGFKRFVFGVVRFYQLCQLI